MLRAGTGAVATEDENGNDAFEAFRRASFADLCQRGRERDADKDAGVKVELGEAVSAEERERLEREEEDEERRLLAGREAISSRKWQGKIYTATNKDIRQGALLLSLSLSASRTCQRLTSSRRRAQSGRCSSSASPRPASS